LPLPDFDIAVFDGRICLKYHPFASNSQKHYREFMFNLAIVALKGKLRLMLLERAKSHTSKVALIGSISGKFWSRRAVRFGDTNVDGQYAT
jgi:hypothetical protein